MANATSRSSQEIVKSFPAYHFRWRKLFFLILCLAVFLVVNFLPEWGAATDPAGKIIPLTAAGKGAVAVFLVAAIWWIFEVVPIGVTSIAIGVFQALFGIRSSAEAFRDFMDPSVLFIFGSLILGLAFTKTGLTRRLAYRMLLAVGERTRTILLGALVVTAALSHIMAHTAAAATVFPLLITIYGLYSDDPATPTRFGKGLFIGMAYAAGAGSIVTFLGSARAAAAAGMFREFTGRDVSFLELTRYMAPVGWAMVLLVWLIMLLVFRPERDRLPGLRERVRALADSLGPIGRNERIVILTIAGIIVFMTLQSFLPVLSTLDRTSVMLIATLVFYVTGVLGVGDLEDVPWNIVLLFSGAMSLGYCLWKTGAAQWIAVKWIVMFQHAPRLVFVLSVAAFVLFMTNFIMNVAAIAISLPVSLAIAGYLGVPLEVILFASLVAAGMPFLLLIGAAPNAIAYTSRQFSAGEFFGLGIPTSLVLLAVLAVALLVVWPLLGMPALVP